MADDIELQGRFDAEQKEFVALVRSLRPEDWSTSSLCAGWSVRDVITHTAWHIHRGALEIIGSLASSAMSGAAKASAAQIARDGSRSNTAMVAWLESPGTCNLVNLGELLIHQQDVRRPLGLAREIPAERIRPILDFSLTRAGNVNLVPGARRRAAGLRLVATDMDWSGGQGAEVRGPGEAILLAVNGRGAAVGDLTGPGTEILAARMNGKKDR